MVYSENSNLSQYLKISPRNPTYEQVKGEEPHDHINQCKISSWQNSTPIHDKELSAKWNEGNFLNGS